MSKDENSINSYKTYYNQTDQIHQMFQRLEKVHKDNCFYSEYPGYTVMRFIRDSSIFYRIFVISQEDDLTFNRAMLFNVGYKEAMQVSHWDCLGQPLSVPVSHCLTFLCSVPRC